MKSEPLWFPCHACPVYTPLTDATGRSACPKHGGLFPDPTEPTREQKFGPSPFTTVILPGKDKYLIGLAAERDSAPADNGGWFAVWMRKLLTDPIQYPIRKTSGKRD